MSTNSCLTPQGVDLKWLEENLPHIPVNLLDDVVQIAHRHGVEAVGVFYNGIIELGKNSPRGTEYHEAFHAVFNSYLSEEQGNKILKETGKTEEQLANEFEDHYKFNIKPSSNVLTDFFNKLKFWIKEKLGLLKIHDLYSGLNSGYFKNKKPLNLISNNAKFKEGELLVKSVNIYAGTGENADLSNFAIRPFTVNVETPSGEKQFTFQSVEQGFHFYKAMIANNSIVAKKILETTNGGTLKNLTNRNNLKLTPEQLKEWDNTSKSIMLNLMYDSFLNNPEASKKLLLTGNAVLTHKFNGVEQDNGRFSEVITLVREMLQDDIESKEIENKVTVKTGVPELFESNPELAERVYEALGFANTKTQIAKVKTSNKIITQYSDGTFDVVVDEEAYNKAKKEYNDNFEKRKNTIPQLIEEFKSGKRKDWGDDFLTEIIRNTFNGQFKYDKELNSFVTQEIEGDEENVVEGFKPAKFDKVTGKVGSRLGFNKVAETEIFKQLTEANNKMLKDDLGILDLWKSQEGIDRKKAEIQANYDLYEFDKYKQLNKEFVVPKNKGYVIRTVNGGLLSGLYGSSGIQTAIAYQENGTMPLKDSKGNYKYDAYMFIDRVDATGVYIRYTEVKSELRGKGISNLLLNRVRELYPSLPIHRTMIYNPIIVKQSLKINGVTDKKGNKLTGLKTDNDIKKWLESNDELIIPPLNTQITPQQKQQAQQLYSQYLDTIFPDSKVKDVVYHGSQDKNIERFSKDLIGTTRSGGKSRLSFGEGFYFSPTKLGANEYAESDTDEGIKFTGKVYSVILNNPQLDLLPNGTPFQLVVKESEQIHILGSKQDVEGFKDFISNSKTENKPTKNWLKVTDISESDKIELVNSGTYITMFDLMEEQGVNNPYYLDLSKFNQEDLVKKVRKSFQKLYNTKEDLPQESHYLIDKIIEPKNLQFLVKRTLKELENKTTMKFDVEDDLLLEENISEEIYEKSKFKVNPTEKFGTEFNMFLGSLTKRVIVDGKLVNDRNKLGLPQYLTRAEVLNDLFDDISNINDVNKMIEVLESKKDDKPHYYELLEYVKERRYLMKINKEIFRYDSFKNTFFSNLNLYYKQFVTATTEIKEKTIEVPDGMGSLKKVKVTTVTARTSNTNTQGVNNPLLQEFKATVNINVTKENVQALAKQFNLTDKNGYYIKEYVFNTKEETVYLDNTQKDQLIQEIDKLFNIKLSKKTVDFFIDTTNIRKTNNAPSYRLIEYKNIPVLFEALEELITANKNEIGTSKNLKKLVNKEAEERKIYNKTLTAKDGTKFYAIKQYTATEKLLTNIKNKGYEYLQKLKIDRFFYNNPIINGDSLVSSFESNNIVINGDNTSKAYQEMNSLEWEKTCLEMYHNNTTYENGNYHGTLPLVTPSDASNIEVRGIIKRNNLVENINGSISVNTLNNVLYNSYILPELKRIKKVKDINFYINHLNTQLKASKNDDEKRNLIKEIKSLTVKEWNKQGEGFVMFPELNPLVDTLLVKYGSYLEGENEIFDNQSPISGQIIAEISPILSNHSLKYLQIDFNHFQEIGLINKEGLLNNKLVSDSARNYLRDKPAIFNYLANRWISNLECTIVQSGDLAFYKSFEDANKRAKQAQVPARSVQSEMYKVVFTESLNKESQYYEAFKDVIGEELAKGYTKTDTTDAATFATMKRITQICNAKGKDGRLVMEAIKRITENTGLDYSKDLDFVIQSLKTFTFGHMSVNMNYKVQDEQGNFTIDKSSTTLVPTQIKHAVIPLIPAFIEKHPQLKLLNEKMLKEDIGEWIFDSGTKVGTRNLVSKEEASEWLKDETGTITLSTVELDMEHWGEVLDVPYKNETSEKLSSQKMRKAMENINPIDNYNVNWSKKPITGQELIDHYNKAIDSVLRSQFETLEDKIFTDGVLDVEKFKTHLKGLIEANDPNSFTQYWDDILENLTDNNLHVLDTPFNKNKIYSLLASNFNKEVLDIEITGKSAVLASTYGLQGDGIDIIDLAKNLDGTLHSAQSYNQYTDINVIKANLVHIQREFNRLGMNVPQDEIQALEALKTTSIVTADEIIVTPAYFIKSLKKKGIDPTIFMDKNGNFNADLLPEELRFVSFHRIPYQDKNSNSKSYIKSFTNVSSGTVIYFSPDILSRSGGDFDIDKVYIEFYDYMIKDNQWILDQDNPKNQIIDSHLAVASSPHHYKELVTPNNAEGIRTIRDNLTKGKQKENTPWYSVKKQGSYRAANKACKDLIGIYSVMNVFHGIAQQIKPKFKDGYGVFIDGLELTQFGEKEDLEGNLISDNNQQYGTAAVDGVKDPMLGELNHSVFTAPLKGMLNLLGIGKTRLEQYTNNPMYIAVGKYYDEYSLTETSSKATRKAFEQVAKDNNFNEFAWSYLNDFYTIKQDKIVTDKKGKNKTIKVNKKSDILFRDFIKQTSSELKPQIRTDVSSNMLYNLMYHHQLASKTSDFIQGSRLSNSGIKNNVAENILNLNKNKEYFLKSEFIEFNQKVLDTHWLGTYNRLMQGNFRNMISKVNTYHTPFYELTFKKAKEYGISLNNRTQVDTFYRALDMLISLNDNYSLRETYKSPIIKKGEFLEKFPNLFFNRYIKTNVGKNHFLNNLQVGKDSNGKDDLRFKWNDDLYFDQVSAGATEFYNEHPEAAKRLFGYSLKKYGFGATKLNPLNYMEALYSDLGVDEKYQKDYTTIKSAKTELEFPDWFDMDSFLVQYAMNNPNYIRKAYKNDKDILEVSHGLNNYEGQIIFDTRPDFIIQKESFPKSQGNNNYVANVSIFDINLEKEEGCYWG